MKKGVEIWKDVVGYEGLYFVSNFGNVSNANGKMMKLETSQRGYLRVMLYKDGNSKKMKVHRLVAEAFIPNVYGLPQVNHINECKTDNRVSNLCWTDNRCNSLMKSNRKTKRKKVAIVDDRDRVIATFDSLALAESVTGTNRYSIISVCNGIRKFAGNRKWKYIE